VLVQYNFYHYTKTARIFASNIFPIETLSHALATVVAIRMTTRSHGRGTFERLWDLLALHKGDRPVAFRIEERDRRLVVRIDVNPQIRVRPSEQLVAAVEKICGRGSVSLR